jgi:hypothetical protein
MNTTLFAIPKTLIISTFILASCGKISGQESNKASPAPNIRPEILKLIREIATDNVLKSDGVGYEGIRTDQWKRYETLKSNATDNELKELSNNINTVVRCYSFQALASRKVDVFPILLQHLSDTAKVTTFMGCIISSEKSGDYFADVVTPEYIDLDCYKLNQYQQVILDSILINDSTVKINRKNSLLAIIKPNPKFYKRIRQEAEQGNLQATLALARFKKDEDISVIEKLFLSGDKNGYYAIYSAREFPSSTFYPYLIKVFKEEWKQKLYDYSKWRLLYQALAKYPTDETYSLFEKTVQTRDDFRRQTLGACLLLALRKYPNPKFTSLIHRIKLDSYHLEEASRESDVEK